MTSTPTPAPPPGDRPGSRGPVLALDIGGTKLAAALVGPDGEILVHDVVPTPVSADAEVVFAALATLVRRLLPQAGASGPGGVGISSAGPVDSDLGTVSPVNIAAWRGFPLRERVARLLDVPVPTLLAGDGICMAVGEHWLGAGRGANAMLGVVTSTGVGGGLVLDGHVHAGSTANAGHIGHMSVELDGEPCPCGGRGCVEIIASGPSLVRYARRTGWDAPEGATARELADDARAGDPVALAAFTRGGRALGAAFTAAAVICDLDRVVLGGGVAQAGAVFFDAVRAGLREFAGLEFTHRVTIVPAELGASAGLVGAAALLLRPRRYGFAHREVPTAGPPR